MTNQNFYAPNLLKELEAEVPACRKCLERIPTDLSAWKPHEKSMQMGYLTLLVAEIPLWIAYTIDPGEIDFATFKPSRPKTAAESVQYFDENVNAARKALQGTTDEKLSELFSLKREGKLLMSMPKKENIGQSINHLVHHRGQLTVYMRLNNIAVPSIYGPSADERVF